MELCIASLQSSFVGEREQEESFESAGKNVDSLLCCAEARGIPRMLYLMSITQDVAIRWGLSVEGLVALSTFPEQSVLDLGNAVNQILMAAAQLYLPCAAVLKVKC